MGWIWSPRRDLGLAEAPGGGCGVVLRLYYASKSGFFAGLVKTQMAVPPPAPDKFLFSRVAGGPLEQGPWWCWCYWSEDPTLRTTDVEDLKLNPAGSDFRAHRSCQIQRGLGA